jgi:hypothetical protein
VVVADPDAEMPREEEKAEQTFIPEPNEVMAPAERVEEAK